jgi:hypothetical protein
MEHDSIKVLAKKVYKRVLRIRSWYYEKNSYICCFGI